MPASTNSILRFVGTLKGHSQKITSLCTPGQNIQENILLSTSRDKKAIIWQYYPNKFGSSFGYAMKALQGHSQEVSDITLSSDSLFAITASWDKTLRLWDLVNGKKVRTFQGHQNSVNSVALSPDNRQIVSASSDNTIRLWNAMAECKYTIVQNQHTHWISNLRFSPSTGEPLIVSCGWDSMVKLWNLQDCTLKQSLSGHTLPLYSVTVSPDGSLCASGGKSGTVMLWDVNEGKHLYSLSAYSPINSLCFSPCNYWLCAATDSSIKIWNLEDKNILADIVNPPSFETKVDINSTKPKCSKEKPWAMSLTWSADGNILFVGSASGDIYVYDLHKHENRSY